MSLATFLQNLDTDILVFINDTWAHPFLDHLLPIWREKLVWIPFYIVTIIILLLKWKKRALLLIALLILAVIVGDVVSSHIIKPYFGRLRPCADASVFPLITMRAPYCGGNGSFTSSHATNHSIIAVYLMLTLGRYLKFWKWLLLLWALTIGYAQVYVGVHYPSDIIGGVVLGSIIAFFFYKMYVRLRLSMN